VEKWKNKKGLFFSCGLGLVWAGVRGIKKKIEEK